MKEMSGVAETTVAATAPECIALLVAVDRYPEWYPDVVTRAEVIDRDAAGHPTRAQATVHVSLGPLVRDFDLLLDVVARSQGVRLVRVPHESSDPERFEVDWEVSEGRDVTIRVLLAARLDVPRLLPVGGVGESLAQGFVAAAKRALERSSPNAPASSS